MNSPEFKNRPKKDRQAPSVSKEIAKLWHQEPKDVKNLFYALARMAEKKHAETYKNRRPTKNGFDSSYVTGPPDTSPTETSMSGENGNDFPTQTSSSQFHYPSLSENGNNSPIEPQIPFGSSYVTGLPENENISPVETSLSGVNGNDFPTQTSSSQIHYSYCPSHILWPSTFGYPENGNDSPIEASSLGSPHSPDDSSYVTGPFILTLTGPLDNGNYFPTYQGYVPDSPNLFTLFNSLVGSYFVSCFCLNTGQMHHWFKPADANIPLQLTHEYIEYPSFPQKVDIAKYHKN